MYLFIHRKDLRSRDLRAFEALKKRRMPGLHLAILDPALLQGRLTSHSGQAFLRQLAQLRNHYSEAGKTLHLLYGPPSDIVDHLLSRHLIAGIVVHADYTPYAQRRDESLLHTADRHGRPLARIDDLSLASLKEFHAFSERSEPYKVFTPFYRKWSSYMEHYYSPSGDVSIRELETVRSIDEATASRFALPPDMTAALEAADGQAGLDPSSVLKRFTASGLSQYNERRDAFGKAGTSGLSRYLNLGALSARTVYEAVLGKPGSESWIRQLAWRDFYLYQAVYNADFFSYEKRYDLSPLTGRHFEAWSRGETGVPIIDAAMAQLNQTGELPNRLRMVAAMFLTKNLLCPFTLGEAYFRKQLADYDNTLNRGGWLWSSSLGYDAAPYFRIMNPTTQSAAHDPTGAYIRTWLPRFAHLSDREIHHPASHAIVDLKASRARAIEVYKEILGYNK